MSASTSVVTIILLQQGCFALLWVGLGIHGLARSSTANWAVATGLVSFGMLMIGLRGQVPDLLSFQGANVAVIVGFVVLYRGVANFVGRTSASIEHLALLVIGALILVPTLASGMQAWQFAACSALMSLINLRMAWLIQHDLRQEFGGKLASLCAGPFWLMGTVLGVRTVMAALSEGTSAYVYQTNGRGLWLLFAYLVFGLLMNFGLVGMLLSRVMNRLRHLSERDALTGLYNRRSIEHRLAQETAQLARYGTALSLLSIDIDHFKRINDLYGHPAGDRVLKDLAQALAQVGRGADLLARAGGEEFWMLLPRTTLSGAMQVAERALHAARELKFEGPLASVTTTVSIGVVVADDPSETLESVMARMDLALYRAKDLGRDRIELAGPRTTRPSAAGALSAPELLPAPAQAAKVRPRATA
jgi:diguanylate cyclase (GGDEF)-like protein